VIDLVGFSITNDGDREALRSIAEAGGGVYQDLQSQDDFNNYVQSIVEMAHARAKYARCIGQEAVFTNVCYTQLVTFAELAISQRITELANDFGSDHEAEILALEQIQEDIARADELRTERYMEWEAEHLSLLDEMDDLENLYDNFFPGP
jgi:hypothetical protein